MEWYVVVTHDRECCVQQYDCGRPGYTACAGPTLASPPLYTGLGHVMDGQVVYSVTYAHSISIGWNGWSIASVYSAYACTCTCNKPGSSMS